MKVGIGNGVRRYWIKVEYKRAHRLKGHISKYKISKKHEDRKK